MCLLRGLEEGNLNNVLNCGFETSTCDWSNDPNNWPINWKLDTAYTNSLDLKTNKIIDQQVHMICISLNQPIESQVDHLSARLFGPLIAVSNQPQCLEFIYKIELDPSQNLNVNRLPSLSLLRRFMG